MKIAIVSDSILCQHVFKDEHQASTALGCEVSLKRSSSLIAYEIIMKELSKPDYDAVLVSTLLNHIAQLENAWNGGQYDEDKDAQVKALIKKATEPILELAKIKKVLVLPPMLRTTPSWMAKNLTVYTDHYISELSGAGSNVIILDRMVMESKDLAKDGVHPSTQFCAKIRAKLVQDIKDNLDVSNVMQVDESSQETRKRSRPEPENRTEEMMMEFWMEMREFRDEFRAEQPAKRLKLIDTRVNQAMIASAKSQEQIDALYNKERKNLILVKSIGKRAGDVIPDDHSGKIRYIQGYVKEALATLPKDKQEIVNILSMYVMPFGEAHDSLPTIRLTCGSSTEAVEVRNRILIARNSKLFPWINAEVSNDPVKATRVRISLLMSVARKLRSGGQECIVTRFSESPSLILKRDGKNVQLTFVEAMLEFGGRLDTNDVGIARRVAGNTFKNTMEQYFLVLKEMADVEIPCPVLAQPGADVVQPELSSRGRAKGRGGQAQTRCNRGTPIRRSPRDPSSFLSAAKRANPAKEQISFNF